MAGYERYRLGPVGPPVSPRQNATAPPADSGSDKDDDDDYTDAGPSLQQYRHQQQKQQQEEPQQQQQQQHGYMTSAVRRSVIPEAAYSRLDLSGAGLRLPRRRVSSTCGCFTVIVAFVSILMNVAMAAAALAVIVGVTSPADSDVVCALMRILRCCHDDDSNRTVQTADVSAASSSLVQPKGNDSTRSIFTDKMADTATDGPAKLECAAHLFFIYQDSQYRTSCPDANDYLKLTNWSDGGKHAFARRPCITADSDSGAIRVTRGGHYVFYDHLAVCRCAAGGFRQRVRRRPAAGGEAETLLEAGSAGRSQGTGGEGCAGHPAFSSDLFAVVRLEDGDLVWIEAKPASAVYRPNDASFFGLYRLSFF